ncbi:hypothetical protein LUZ60_005870 [Juncus effusus]|nr:hypothetical protein LUZ60_005870 [Juncus effusus]
MAIKQTITLCLFSFLALILTINGVDVAAPAPSVDCMSTLMNMMDCLTFAENGSTITKPEKGCCPGLKMVVEQNVECLCELFKNSANFGISLDFKKALSLPSVCHVKTPPFSECNITLPGVSSPVTSPVASGPSNGDASSTPTGEASISTSPGPSPSKSTAAIQIKAHPFTTITIAIFASTMLIFRNSI